MDKKNIKTDEEKITFFKNKQKALLAAYGANLLVQQTLEREIDNINYQIEKLENEIKNNPNNLGRE